MNRHQMRENAFILVFERIFIDDSVNSIIEDARESEHFEINADVESLVVGVEQHKQELDEIITKHLNKWSLSRISKVLLAILRVAVYEILYVEKVETPIAINEAVELAKEYSCQEDAAFVNGVLGSFVREVEESK